MELPTEDFKGLNVVRVVFKLWCISSLKVVLILATNSAEPDEMQHDVAFHLGLHCL